MRHGTIIGLLLWCVWKAPAIGAQTVTCDRECLRGKVTQLLHALVKHDVSGLPVADTLRVTEDAVEKPLVPASPAPLSWAKRPGRPCCWWCG